MELSKRFMTAVQETVVVALRTYKKLFDEEKEPLGNTQLLIPSTVQGLYFLDRTPDSEDPTFDLFNIRNESKFYRDPTNVKRIISNMLMRPLDWRQTGELVSADLVILIAEGWRVEAPPGTPDDADWMPHNREELKPLLKDRVLSFLVVTRRGQMLGYLPIKDGEQIGALQWEDATTLSGSWIETASTRLQ